MNSQNVQDLLLSLTVPPDYRSMLSKAGKRIVENKLRTAFQKDIADGKKIMLSNGLPNTEKLPINSLQFTLQDGSMFSLSQEEINQMNTYGVSEGLTELRHWLMGLHYREHRPPQLTRPHHPESFSLAITNGITDGLRNIFHVLLDEGDPILIEKEIFSNLLTVLQLFDIEPVTVESKSEGMIASELDQLLSTWTQLHPHTKRPRVLYTITACSNPTGHTWTVDTLVDVYHVCRKHEVLIIEDAAYYFLQFGQRTPGFQSIDVDGRVIRLDSFSKILGAGYRVGWISGPWSLVSRYVLSMSQNTVHPCVLSQIMINRILQSWGYDRFNEEMNKLSKAYYTRAQHMANMMVKYMSGLATWTFPRGGLFFWIKINEISNTSDLKRLASAAGVSVVSGDFFIPKFKPSPSVRLSYSMGTEQDIEEGIKIFANVVRSMKSSSATEN